MNMNRNIHLLIYLSLHSPTRMYTPWGQDFLFLTLLSPWPKIVPGICLFTELIINQHFCVVLFYKIPILVFL